MAQAAFEFETLPASAQQQPRAGFELGWDYAHYGVVPPAEHMHPAHPLRQGWDAGRAAFGQRTLKPNRHVRKWLQLRLHAWLRGRSFESVQVTPHYLAQIDTARCPVTRSALTHATGSGSDASVDRVYNDAGYAAGNLAVISSRANRAKAGLAWDEARLLAVQAEARATGQPAGSGTIDGLAAAEWARLAVLMSFVTPLPHAVAATLPLLLLPPNRLRLLNGIQGLQALVTLQLAHAGWSARIVRLSQLMPDKALRRDFNLFFHSLLPRVFEGGRPTEAVELRERLEDAWRHPLVLRRWQRFALQLSGTQAEALLQRAAKLGLGLGLGNTQLQVHALQQATEGWALATGGYDAGLAANDPAPHAVQTPGPAPLSQRRARLAAVPASLAGAPLPRQATLIV